MAKIYSNILSRAVKRHNEARQEINGDSDRAPDQNAIQSSADGQSARILPMPNLRSSNKAANDSAANKTTTPETWEWSKPPDITRRNFSEQNANVDNNESTALVPNNVREIMLETTAAKSPETAFVRTASKSSAALIESSPTSFRAGGRAKFRTVEINVETVEPHLVAITQPRSVHSEEFRNLRTQILHASERQKLQAITIASGSPSEGKSTVALNLAWLLAQTDGISALVIDSDLRLPCLADYLGVKAKPGLSEVFSDEADLENAIVRLEPSGLHLLPGGAARDDVAEMLSGNRFRTILEQTRKMFDYIIVDAPSLGIFTDAAVLINQTDAALLVVRAGKTKYQTTNRLLETLPRERILGVVLNGSNDNLADESHYDSYYYENQRRGLLGEIKESQHLKES